MMNTQLEWYSYFPISIKESVMKSRKKLPLSIVDALISDPPVFQQLVSIDSSKTTAIAELDRFFGIGTAGKYFRALNLEGSDDLVSQFQFFFISPLKFEYLDEILFDLSGTTCANCCYGITDSSIANFVRTESFDLAEVFRIGRMQIELVVSKRLRNLFEEHSLTGLEFRSSKEPDYDLAVICEEVWRESREVVSSRRCETHNVVFTPLCVGETYSPSDFSADFCMLAGTRIGSQKFYGAPPGWVVSQKALKIILKKVKTLGRATTRISKCFRPLILDRELIAG